MCSSDLYVQSGWQRASQRALDASKSSPTRPVFTNAKADASPLPSGTWEQVRVEIFPFAHPFRAGSRLRLTINAPGNARAIWQFRTIDDGQTVHIGRGGNHASSVVLQSVKVPNIPRPAPPACGSLRGQPCREYVAAANGG